MFIVAGFGNPLLDITVNIDNDELLKKYKLNEDDQTELPVDEIKSLYNDICKLVLCVSVYNNMIYFICLVILTN